MHAFMLYINDWLSSKNIELMDAAEERGYLRLLLREAQEHDCGLPDDDAVLAHLSLLGPQWFKLTADKSKRLGAMTSGEKLRQCFIHIEGHVGRIFNERLLKEWERHQTICDRNRENGKRFGVMGGRPKKTQVPFFGLPTETQVPYSGNPKITPPSPSPSPVKETTANAVAKKDSAKAPSDAKGSRLKEESLPAEWREWAGSKLGWDHERCQRVFDEFHDYWVAVPGAKGCKLKWFPTWKNRCRELNERIPRQQGLIAHESNTDRAIKRAYELHEQGLL